MLIAPAAPTLAPPALATPVPRLAFIALALAALASGVSMRLADALLPRLAREFGVSLGQAAQVVTVFAVAYGVAQMLFGPLGDRFGKYRVVGWACIASALAALACGWVNSHAGLLLARALAGVSAAAVIPLAMAWIGDVVPYAQRQPVLARFLIGQITGFGLGAWSGGFAAEHLDWRMPFFFAAALFALAGALMQWVRAGQAHAGAPLAAWGMASPPRQAGASASFGAALAAMPGEFGAVLARPWARAVVLAGLGEGATLYGAFPFIPAHLHHSLGLPLSSAGALVMLFALGGLGFALGAHALVRGLSQAQLVRWGSLTVLAAMLVIAAAPVWWWALPAYPAMGLGFYMMHNTLQTQATQMAPERRGAAVALFAAGFFSGQSLGVAAAGLALDHIGTAGVLVAGGVGMVAVGWNFNRQRQGLAPEA